MTAYRYFEIGTDLWRLSGSVVEFRDRDGDWNPSVLPRSMFLDEADEFGRELTVEEVDGRG